MIYIDPTYHPYFKSLAEYIKSVMNAECEITDDYSKDGIWVLNYASHLTRVQDKIRNNPYIAIQTEQMNVKGNTGYREFLSKAIKVLDWTSNFLIGYSDWWRIECEESKDIDVLFYGLMNAKREQITNQIPNITLVKDKYGRELWPIILRSKIVLSIHYYPQPENDLPRLAPLLSNKVFVIAEETIDPWFNDQSDAIVIAKREEIPSLCEYYLKNPIERIKMIDKGYEFIKSIKNDPSF